MYFLFVLYPYMLVQTRSWRVTVPHGDSELPVTVREQCSTCSWGSKTLHSGSHAAQNPLSTDSDFDFFFSYRKLMNWTYQISSIAGRESIYFVNPHKLCTVFLWPFNSKKHECHYKGKNLSLRLAINKSPTMPSRLKNINQLFFQCFLFQYIFKLKIKIASILLKNLQD